jgi:RNA polymerase subunit RPABC4/transcription elongation factor Spt4
MEAVIARSLQVLITLSGAYLLALWFVLVVWTYRDIESRSKNVITQVFSTLLVVLFFIPGIVLYLMLRPRETLDATFQRSLEEEYLLQDLEELPLCPSCQRYVEDDFRICPHCRTALRETCGGCGRLVDVRWPICPYCGSEEGVNAPTPQLEVHEPRWVEPAAAAIEGAAPAPAVAAPAAAAIAPPAAAPAPAAAARQAQTGEQPNVLTVLHHGASVAAVRPFDRRHTRASGRRTPNLRPPSGAGGRSATGETGVGDMASARERES